jgi:hypothetical protein
MYERLSTQRSLAHGQPVMTKMRVESRAMRGNFPILSLNTQHCLCSTQHCFLYGTLSCRLNDAIGFQLRQLVGSDTHPLPIHLSVRLAQ